MVHVIPLLWLVAPRRMVVACDHKRLSHQMSMYFIGRWHIQTDAFMPVYCIRLSTSLKLGSKQEQLYHINVKNKTIRAPHTHMLHSWYLLFSAALSIERELLKSFTPYRFYTTYVLLISVDATEQIGFFFAFFMFRCIQINWKT